MAYATQNQSHTRMNALVAVGAIHAIGIYVLATGLAGGGGWPGGAGGVVGCGGARSAGAGWCSGVLPGAAGFG